MCSKLAIRGVKNVKKDIMINMIIDSYKNQVAYRAKYAEEVGGDEGPSKTKKEVQCTF